MQRRHFLKSAGLLGTASLLEPELVLAGPRLATARYFDVHPFVTGHPEAVFIQRTQISSKTDKVAKKQAGLDLVRQVLFLRDDPGIPLSHKIAFKPNMKLNADLTLSNMSLGTDVSFSEGICEGLKELGLGGDQLYLREGNHMGDASDPEDAKIKPYADMTERVGAHLVDFDSGRDMRDAALENLEEGSEVNWVEVPDGVIFNRIGYVAPMNQTDAWNLNVAKFKAHGMGLTLCCKNWQGTNVHPHVHYCSGVPRQFRNSPASGDVQPDYRDTVQRLFEQHLEAGVPRWDRPGNMDTWNSGPGMEMWTQKTLDNLSVSPIGLSIIEGLYGRPEKAADVLSNVLIFGRSPVMVDIIGHWLGGHEPGNFGLFHAARDRGLSDRLNPHAIPVYDWNGGIPVQTLLEEFPRTPLTTYYLQRDYAGQNEGRYHLVDEPYAYDEPSITAVLEDRQEVPQAFVLNQNHPNPFNASTLIEYRLPQAGDARIEIYNARGQLVEVLVDRWHANGSHVVAWDAGHRASGTYFYRFLTGGFQESRKMLLVR